jgi:hypothetical protein
VHYMTVLLGYNLQQHCDEERRVEQGIDLCIFKGGFPTHD